MGKTNISEKKSLARSLFDSNDLVGAKQQYIAICNKKPDADSLYMLGIIYGMTSDLPNSEKAFSKASKLMPDNDLIWNNLAITQMKQGKYEKATYSLKRSLSLNPSNTHALNSLGNIYRQTGETTVAEEYFNKAITLDPNDPASQTNLGNLFLDRCQYDRAIEYYLYALKINPDYFDAHYNLGSTYQSKGQHEKAIESYRQAQRLNPSATQPISAIANSYEKQGKNIEVLNMLKPIIDTGIRSPDVVNMYSRACLNLKEYDDGINTINQCLGSAQLTPIEQQELQFCLGELYDRCGDYDKAFMQFHDANNLRPFTYNAEDSEKFFNNIATQFISSDHTPAISIARASTSPIFVLGMPRSGTSLVEQILSSHDQVYGAGELPLISEIIEKLKAQKGDFTYPDDINSIDETDLDQLADYYLNKSREDAGSEKHIIDKMPHNFLYIGLIFMLFPNCRVIHCMRDPIDVCLSIYFHNFNSNHPYSDNLKNLGIYYNQYKKLMAHWVQHNSSNIYEISYERLLSEPEICVKQMLDFLGLEWQDDCMRFYENRRTVSTPSYTQVRQPLYKSSMNRWKNYESHLTELIKAIQK